MTYGTVQNVSSMSGLVGVVATQVPIFIPMTLFSLFVITCLASYFSQLRLRGFADIWMSVAVSGYFVTVVSVVISLDRDIPISVFTILACIVVAIVGTVMMFFGKDDI